MQLDALKNFCLVGGTALSLKYGHRTSIDLDLFSNEKFDHAVIVNALEKEFADQLNIESQNTRWGIFCFIRDIKVDIVYYPHPIIKSAETIDGIRLYSSEDIVAMKINAILGRGKKKDFYDLDELLRHFSLKKIIELHKQKFPSQNLLITIPQAITYFEDAEESEAPISLKNQTWKSVKKHTQQKVRKFLL
jgi:predicted nucleotidyltransferase component of viral defense system